MGIILAHGTGTQVGDAFEREAILKVYGERGRDEPLILSASKSVIGHTHAAAGLVGKPSPSSYRSIDFCY